MSVLFKFNTLVNEAKNTGSPGLASKRPAQKSMNTNLPIADINYDKLNYKILAVVNRHLRMGNLREAAAIIKNDLTEEDIISILSQSLFPNSDEEYN